MSTSSGFIDISPCPFLADDVRDSSHCHLKHAQTVSTNNPSGSDVAQEHSTCQSHNNNISTVLKIIDDIVDESIVDVQNAMKEEQGDLGHHHGNYVPNEPSVSESSHPGGVPVSTVRTNRPSSMPCVVRTLEYRPTPIAELKRRQAAEVNVMAQEHPSSEYDPTCPSTTIGYCPTPITDLHMSDTQPEQAANKYQEAFEYRGTDMEYDPIMNYRCSTFAKQQKKKLPEISEKDSEDVGSAKPVRKEFKTGQDHHASDSCQGNSDPMEAPVVDDLSNNDKIMLQISESDFNNNDQMNVTGSETDLNNNDGTNLRGSEPEMASLTSFGHSMTENKMVASISDRDKDTKQLIQSKSSSKEPEVSGQLNKLVVDFNISSVLERGDIKKRKTSKYLKDGNICEDQSQTPKVKRLKKKRVLNLLHDNLLKSSSKLNTTDKISSKLRRRVKVFDEEACPEHLPQDEKTCEYPPQDEKTCPEYTPQDEKTCPENEKTCREHPPQDKKTCPEYTPQDEKTCPEYPPQDESTCPEHSPQDENTCPENEKTCREYPLQDEKTCPEYLPHEREGDNSVDFVSEEDLYTGLSVWEEKKKSKKARDEDMPDGVYVSSTSGEYNTVYGKLVKKERKQMEHLKHSVSLTKGPFIKLTDSYNPKLAEKMEWIKTKDTHKQRQEFSVKGKGRSRYSCCSYSGSKKGAGYEEGREMVAGETPRSRMRLTQKSSRPYDLSFQDSNSDSFYRYEEEINPLTLYISSSST
ncbi:uncharacterized protein LOC118414097 [Branchiostoma floridae]|uniref:Uncharacterized protein LOC118414097 n=1 Tax=Branchiostoma floridae TaxID=7739 RepID=C3Y3U1_BRAFL|nr:uncharacterized protein LOC118414097 [Branchiostoma floridae]|eukprot:XP_002608957.1 hypothetical protein BRAFLDRAFT_104986 [Branchiostoma floridae]